MRGEGDRDLELVMAASVLGLGGAGRGATGPLDPLLGPDLYEESHGMGMVPVPRMSLSWVPQSVLTLKNKGNDSKTGSRAEWSPNTPVDQKAFLPVFAGEDGGAVGGTPHPVKGLSDAQASLWEGLSCSSSGFRASVSLLSQREGISLPQFSGDRH